jgi:tetratricopeptide (TPR) repeat protein
MTPSMRNPIILSLLLSIALTNIGTPKANADDTSFDRGSKDFGNGEEMAPPTSRFPHRRDYRAEEKEKAEQKAEQAEAARKQAADNEAKARALAAQSLKQKDDSAINANNRGVAAGQAHRWLEAITAHEEACQLAPANKQFRINLSAARCAYGQEKMQQGDLTAAANMFRKALVAAQDNGLAGKMLVECLKKQGRDPSNSDVRLEIGDQLSAVGDNEGAAVEYQAAMQLQPNARTYTKMGDISLRYGQLSTALNWYRQAIAKDGNFGPAHRQVGMVALSQRDYTNAASSLRKALMCDSTDSLAGETLVSIWRRQVATNPLLAENHLGLAGALQLTGQFTDAETEYRKLEALDPKNPNLSAGLASLQRAIAHAEADKYKAAAETLFNQGLQREALAEIARAASMEPRNAKYQFLFAQCLEANGDYQNAYQTYLKCVLIDPEHNSEAAARIREMQHGMGGRANLGQASQPAQPAQRALPVAMPQFSQPAATPQMTQQASTQSPAAAMSAAQAQTPTRTAQVSQQEAAVRALQEALAHVSDLESQRKYDDAVDLLKQIVARNLQNADMHHRLAVDMLASGTINDAVSEFRLACALRPDKNDYAADLARALAIHKRAQAAGDSASVAATTEVAK